MEPTTTAATYATRFQNARNAGRYAERFTKGKHRRIDAREQAALRRILTGLPADASILDVPCGAGRFVGTLAAGGRPVQGSDVAEEILEFARQQAAAVGANATFFRADAAQLPLPDGAVDIVFSNRLLHHILEPVGRQKFLREFHRVSRRWAIVSLFDYHAFGGLRRLLKRLKGRTTDYDRQPTLAMFTNEVERAGFRIQSIERTGAPWISQKYLVLEKR